MTVRDYIFQEMAYPDSFSMKEFESIPSFTKRLAYAKEHLHYITSGSSRSIFQIDDEKVLKVAKNNKGIAQNTTESDWFLQNYDIFARVFERDNNNTYLEMELAKKLSPSRFKSILGFSLDNLNTYLRWWKGERMGGSRFLKPTIDPELLDIMKSSSWVNDLTDACGNYDFAVPGDFGRINTYGEVQRHGHPIVVIVDFGLSNSTYDDFYAKVN